METQTDLAFNARADFREVQATEPQRKYIDSLVRNLRGTNADTQTALMWLTRLDLFQLTKSQATVLINYLCYLISTEKLKWHCTDLGIQSI